jgi:hypothetical protein
MDTKDVNIAFHYSERLKSNFLVVARGLERLPRLKGSELEGGKEILRGIFDGLRSEISIAKGHIPLRELDLAGMKLMEAEGNIELREYEKARLNLAEALSHVTTLSSKYMGMLKEENLI